MHDHAHENNSCCNDIQSDINVGSTVVGKGKKLNFNPVFEETQELLQTINAESKAPFAK
jgi:hypothetical protein